VNVQAIDSIFMSALWSMKYQLVVANLAVIHKHEGAQE
jgi:hypothetical protein